MLEIKGLIKSYGSKAVLNGIDLQFKAGQIYGIVGENGAGKTTLFKCIAGLESYTGIIDSEYHPMAHHLGYLETDPVMMSYVTGWEYLKLLCQSRGIDTDNFEQQNLFSLPLNQYADTYSTGMKKKLALMGMLLRKNDILILDEPFNGVDIQSNMLISELLIKLKNMNKTIILSSHIFTSLSSICDKIILLSDGQVRMNVTQERFEALETQMKSTYIKENIEKLILE